ncbi:MAG: hypothetical protein ABL940_08440 [Bacteroidia bacterium]
MSTNTTLNSVKSTLKTGEEVLTYVDKKVAYNLLDFWKWSVSDLLSNATRGRFAEFIVGTAIGLDIKTLREEWDAYDLLINYGAKIEIKSAAYIQSWEQKEYSKISFSIKLASHNLSTNNAIPKRHADLYVFCLLKHKDQATIDPLKLEQWEFYILPTYELDNYKRSQSSITLNSLQKLTSAVTYNELSASINEAYTQQTLTIQHNI